MSLPERGRLDWPLQEPSFTYLHTYINNRDPNRHTNTMDIRIHDIFRKHLLCLNLEAEVGSGIARSYACSHGPLVKCELRNEVTIFISYVWVEN